MYSIGTASRLSGVPIETIRIWERRYQKPLPRRSKGGHRQYSDEDVVLLRALKTLVDRGVRIGSLADQDVGSILENAASRAEESATEDQGGLNELVHEALQAGRARNTVQLGQILDRPLRVGHPADVVLGLYLPLLRLVGDEWKAGRLEIATEHFIEKQVTGRLHRILAQTQVTSGPTAVLAGLPGERHEGGLLASGILLSQLGFQLSFYGVDLPVDELVASLHESPPQLLVLSAVVPPRPSVARALREALHEPNLVDVVAVVGGQSATAIQSDRILGLRSLDDLTAVARRLPGRTEPLSS